MLRRIKADPNPIGAENFLFVNGLNGWGEGNVLEPSMQFGDGYKRAMMQALRASGREHVWPNQAFKTSIELKKQKEAEMGKRPDVCVMVRAHEDQGDDKIFKLEMMLRSLQKQKNVNWRAVIYETNLPNFGELDDTVVKMLDSGRMKTLWLSADHLSSDTPWKTTDYVVNNLKDLADNECGQARYVLLTDGSTTYAPEAFDKLPEMDSDLIALNTESKFTIWGNDNWEDMEREDFCERLLQVRSTSSSQRIWKRRGRPGPGKER